MAGGRRPRAGGSRAPEVILTQLACERADVVLACSDVDAAAIRRLAPAAQVRVVENGVRVSALSGLGPTPGTEAPLVTFTGFLAYWPNADACAFYAHEILPHVRARVPGARFRIVGRVPPTSVMALAATPGVEVVADVPDMRPYFAAAQVIVAPIRAGSGTRLKILEAFAAGRPVVSTSVGCEGLPVVHGEHLLIADDPVSFAEAVVRLLADPTLADHLTGRARELVTRRFDHAVLRQRLLEVYRSLAAHPPAGPARRAARTLR